MKKFVYFLIVILLGCTLYNCSFAQENKGKNTKISNKYFSVQIPDKAKGTYQVKKEKDKISIYDKAAKKAGFGGFAFGIKVYKNPSDHAMMPGARKLGELVDKKGVIYDVVLKQPTDVQYDYVKGDAGSYHFLYNLADKIGEKIDGIKGSKYIYKGGTQGKDLYKDILKKHVLAIEEKLDSTKLEQGNMSYMYNVLAATNKNVLDKVGYAYYDTNVDGIDELLIGEIADGSWKGVIYDMYTMVDRRPVHVVSGGSRNRYFVCDTAFICNEYSGGANESGVTVYNLVENSTELFPQVYFKYDGYQNTKSPWFLKYGSDNNWENISEKAYKERKEVFDKYERFNFIPLSTLK